MILTLEYPDHITLTAIQRYHPEPNITRFTVSVVFASGHEKEYFCHGSGRHEDIQTALNAAVLALENDSAAIDRLRNQPKPKVETVNIMGLDLDL